MQTQPISKLAGFEPIRLGSEHHKGSVPSIERGSSISACAPNSCLSSCQAALRDLQSEAFRHTWGVLQLCQETKGPRIASAGRRFLSGGSGSAGAASASASTGPAVGYKWRHLIENFFCKLKEFKRIAMRADKN
jgi:hypothetical protein